ncbi:bifunctional coenzyme A synthase-like [Patiria miniata]|uniref:Uncharacterized protein n=1 Tax=Patiria miniata TaxID=46514 RepID=A0A913Z2F6_PATMI|nr:bifunctional coenzyme A synthase-like [Patiria miniata]
MDARIASVRDFIHDIKPRILQSDSIVPITDPYGPSVVDPDMRCIVVSEETKKGGDAVNRVRQDKGLCVLDVHEISLVEDINHAAHGEAKISPSTQRIGLLGTLLKQPTHVTYLEVLLEVKQRSPCETNTGDTSLHGEYHECSRKTRHYLK